MEKPNNITDTITYSLSPLAVSAPTQPASSPELPSTSFSFPPRPAVWCSDQNRASDSGDVLEKKGRHSRFTPADDFAILRVFVASKAHIAFVGETRSRFTMAETHANVIPSLHQSVTLKIMQDHYKRLQELFGRKNKKEQLMSGVGGKVGGLMSF